MRQVWFESWLSQLLAFINLVLGTFLENLHIFLHLIFLATCEIVSVLQRWGDQRTERLINLSHVCACAQSLSCVQLFTTPWAVAYQAPLSVGFSRQEYWTGLPFSYSRGSSWPKGLNPHLVRLLHCQADSLPLHHPGSS